MMPLDVVVLAAGKGTRMRSQKAKVLHTIAGTSMLQHVLNTAQSLNPRTIAVVIGHQADEVKSAIDAKIDTKVEWVHQQQQNGTGHAVQTAMPHIPADGVTLVLYGDVPLIQAQTLESAVEVARTGKVGLITSNFDQPAQLGRIVRTGTGAISRIVEFADASDAEKDIQEINSGIVTLPTDQLAGWLNQLDNNNAQGELYLTDVIEMAVADGVEVVGVDADESQVTGVNDRVQLAQLERIYQTEQANLLMLQGVSLADPARLDVRGEVVAGEDCFIDINVVLSGRVVLGRGVTIGPGAVVIDSEIGDGSEVKPHTVVEGAQLKNDVSVGPFARIRPGSVLENEVKIGNFVETKKAHLGVGSKASHLAYLGDATIGADCNIGAGAVTCNYDGINKHPTTIGDNVFVGTNATMVAPIEIQKDSFVAAGSTVTTKIESATLAVGRAKQRNISGWVRPDQRPKKD